CFRGHPHALLTISRYRRSAFVLLVRTAMAEETNEAIDEPDMAEDEPSAAVLLASAEDLASIDLEKALAGLDHADDLALEQALNSAAKSADEAGDAAGARGYRLLMFLCTLHLR